MKSNIVESYISEILTGEQDLIIQTPMRPECKVAVLIPAFNEDVDTVLMPLLSLAAQTGVDKKEFEVDVIVSNNRDHAFRQTPEFLQNQKIISLIKFINRQAKNYSGQISPEQLQKINNIQESGLVVYVIDKSSAQFANEYENIGIARDRAGAEIVQRFQLNGRNGKGIIALLDADSYYSNNAIACMIKIFASNDINGLGAILELVVDSRIPYADLVEKAFLAVTGYGSRRERIRSQMKKPLQFQKQDSLRYQAISGGHNTVVTAAAWLAAGGMPHYDCLEALRFTKKIINLPGDVASTTDYKVFTLLRVSERVGFMSAGRMVLEISRRVSDYMEKKSVKLFLPRFGVISAFFEKITDALEINALDVPGLTAIFKECNFRGLQLSRNQMAEMVAFLSDDYAEATDPNNYKATFARTNKLVLDNLWKALPEEDYTFVLSQTSEFPYNML